ncbi:MAG: TIGR03564 family F420-dependent LLM class oxidoreductase [Pseudomonadota bacterium]
MSPDRMGVRWGLAGGVALPSIGAAMEMARFAELAGFDSFWISQAAGIDPVVAMAVVGQAFPTIGELGTSIVPLYGRHPLALAQLALTAQSALQGRFTLGVGAASKWVAEDKLGMSWDRPFSFTTEFINGMQPLLNGAPAHVEGDQLTTRAELSIDAAPVPILLAALGPRMLKFAGARVAGTTLGQCGPRTIREYVLPNLQQGATDAGRTDRPRVMALVRVCVTDDRAGAYALAKEISAFYQSFPSYRAVLARERLNDPADLHLIGSRQQVIDGLAEYARAGATDLRVEVAAHTERATQDTRQLLVDHLT